MGTKDILNKIKRDKYEISNWNKHLIKMDDFMSFLIIDVEKIKNHLGSSTGWTRYENEKNKLIVKGGWFNGIEYLHNIEFGEKLSNVWNNFVNPFYLFDIFNDEGKKFFLKYYEDEINEVVKEHGIKINQTSIKLKRLKKEQTEIIDYFKNIDLVRYDL